MGALTAKVQVRGTFRVSPCHPVSGRFSGSRGFFAGRPADLWGLVKKKIGVSSASLALAGSTSLAPSALGDALLSEPVEVRLLEGGQPLKALGAEQVHVRIGSGLDGYDEDDLDRPVRPQLQDDAVRGLVAVTEVDLAAI